MELLDLSNERCSDLSCIKLLNWTQSSRVLSPAVNLPLALSWSAKTEHHFLLLIQFRELEVGLQTISVVTGQQADSLTIIHATFITYGQVRVNCQLTTDSSCCIKGQFTQKLHFKALGA